MSFLEAILLSIIEGLAEFLPISSTGHLILTRKGLGIPDSAFVTSFTIAIQCGSIAAVVLLYWRRFLLDRQTLLRVLLAFVPTMIVGFTLYKLIRPLLDSAQVVLWSLGVGGVALIVFEWLHGEKKDALDGVSPMTYWQAAAIGLFQALAIIPGVSRSAATVIGGMLLGVSRKTMVEFSFLLAAPTLAAAAGYDLLQHARDFSAQQVEILIVGTIVACLVALIAIRGFLHYIKSHTLIGFGWYRIAAALGFAAWLYWT